MAGAVPVLDGERMLRDLQELNRIGALEGGGISRIAFGPADREGREWVEEQMRALGMLIRRDSVGNTLAVLPGREPGRAPIGIGSHTDSVPSGGRYDGALGVVAALAAVRSLRESGQTLRHSLELINFQSEESTMSGGTFGSRAMSGQLDPDVVNRPAYDGRPVSAHMVAAGLDPAAATSAARPAGALAGFLELHVEQGGLLEQAGVQIGAVTGIVGIRRYIATFRGYANHAGTTPMAGRQDALVMAAPFIAAVREIAVRYGIVGTVGTLRLQPGSPNVIPGLVEMDVELRGLVDPVLDQAEQELARQAETAGGGVRQMVQKPPVHSEERLVAAVEQAAAAAGLTCRRMPSGAGHDAGLMAALGPQAMIFVPSRGGVSHSPDEFTEPEACVAGARVLLGALLTADETL